MPDTVVSGSIDLSNSLSGGSCRRGNLYRRQAWLREGPGRERSCLLVMLFRALFLSLSLSMPPARSFRDSARFQARGWRERLLREPHGLLEQQDEPVLCFLCSARAASESSRSSYYSLHMEGSGKLELRWESNITFWKSLRLYRGKARVSSSPSRARSITTPSSPRRKQLQHLPEKRQSERELRGATETFDQRSERVEIVSNP